MAGITQSKETLMSLIKDAMDALFRENMSEKSTL